MYLTHLSLTNFRAFTRLDMDVPGRVLLLVGANAQGKTTLLEAVYYLATYHSFHAPSDRQLINFNAANEKLAVARLVADYHRAARTHRLEVRLIQESNNGSSRLRKEIYLDGVKRTTHEAMGHFNAVIFLPQMTSILEGAPDERRRYLNLAISQASPHYAVQLSEYNQLLTQRNALLKQLCERGGDAGQLTYWDQLLAERGAAIIHQRITAVDELEKLAARFHHHLTHEQEILRVHYQPSYDPLPQPDGQFSLPLLTRVDRSGISVEQIKNGFLERLEGLRREEIARGVTTVGPHRDEMRFLSNGVDLGYYGSRGQIRTALLALKLAEVSWLRNRTGQNPVLLLDEILAELDLQRREDLLKTIQDSEQALLTTTDQNMFVGDFAAGYTIWQVANGQVVEQKAD